MFIPRPGQKEISEYKNGKIGITAVPGSGKTHTLSYLAAKLIASDLISEDQEILIVTLVNSAVNNFSARISKFLSEMGLIPGLGYRVRTLHGLAYDIIREMPQLAGIDNHFSIADERSTNDILATASLNWMRLNDEVLLDYSASGLRRNDFKWNWGQLIQKISGSIIRLAKDSLVSPLQLKHLSENCRFSTEFVNMGIRIYSDYTRALHDRGAVDFDDLIRLAYLSLKNNPGYLKQLQSKWPFVLEDEAQDSSIIQEKMLKLLTNSHKNWVRVGDPNQAIFETFTTADPILLRNFVKQPDVSSIDLPHSGRSTKSIINLANYLISWTKTDHPNEKIRNALDEPFIKPTTEGDPQPNPIDKPDKVVIYDKPLSPSDEINHIAKSAKRWVAANPDKTAAILVPRNQRGSEMIELLADLKVPYLELLSSSKAARDVAAILRDIIKFYSSPLVRRYLSSAVKTIAVSLFN
ncbi:MAG: ATP-dependent helicase, partial [Anaerolineaceae bacterium]|nr:ATP-dependent helicase [Anaerolineaceae bacterium]